MKSAIRINGLRELRKALERMPKELMKAGEKAALRGGAQVISKSAKSRAPIGNTGELKKSIGYTVKTVKGDTTARIGAKSKVTPLLTKSGKRAYRKGEPAWNNPAMYSHLVEYGTSRTAAKPFIRPAVETSKGEVVKAMADGFNKNINKVISKIRSSK